MKYEILTKKGKAARIYHSNHLDLAVKHAKDCNGKVINRLTGEVVANFCKSREKVK